MEMMIIRKTKGWVAVTASFLLCTVMAVPVRGDIRGPDYVRTETDVQNDMVSYVVVSLLVFNGATAATWLAWWAIRKSRQMRSQQ